MSELYARKQILNPEVKLTRCHQARRQCEGRRYHGERSDIVQAFAQFKRDFAV